MMIVADLLTCVKHNKTNPVKRLKILDIKSLSYLALIFQQYCGFCCCPGLFPFA